MTTRRQYNLTTRRQEVRPAPSPRNNQVKINLADNMVECWLEYVPACLCLTYCKFVVITQIIIDSRHMATFNSDRKSDFDLEIVLHAFQRCLRDDTTIILQEYITAYHELCRFFKLTGPLFAFVARDLESKIKAVEYHMHADHGYEYKSLQSMVAYEVKHSTTHTRGSHPSGCRMFLRLHFALEFILSFMKRVMVGDENEKMSKLAWEVYVSTLYKHHPWLTRKLAALAVYALPSKKHLINVMCKQDYNRVLHLLGQVVDSGQPVYDVTEAVLAAHNLLNIS